MAQKASKNRKKNRSRSSAQPTLNTSMIWGLVIVAAIGIALASYALQTTIAIEAGGLENPSSCSINEWINCDAAHASSYAYLLGVPVAGWGLLFYVFAIGAGLYALLGTNKERGAGALATVFVLSLGGILFSLVKAYHLFDLGVLCLICLGMYAVNLIIPVLAFKSFGEGTGGIGGFLGKYVSSFTGKPAGLSFDPQPLRFGVIALVFFALGGLLMNRYEANAKADAGLSQVDLDRALQLHYRQEVKDVRIPESAALWGNPDADVTIIEYSDFECPSCKRAASHIRPILYEYRDDIAFYYAHYPLDHAINDSITRPLHMNAGLAAIASECAQDRGEFWAYHDAIFENQRRLSRDFFLETADRLGFDRAEFESCLADPAMRNRVRDQIAAGNEIGVFQTPTLIIEGRDVDLWNNSEVIRGIIDREMAGN
ncbi:MAG: hypothetical protein RhofKO_28160 [Rhodothermales bacterium]